MKVEVRMCEVKSWVTGFCRTNARRTAPETKGHIKREKPTGSTPSALTHQAYTWVENGTPFSLLSGSVVVPAAEKVAARGDGWTAKRKVAPTGEHGHAGRG